MALLGLTPVHASTAMKQFDRANQAIVDRGTQALVTCNGLFVSNRTLEQIYEQELKLDGGDLRVCGLNESVKEVFDISGFSNLLVVLDDETKALEGF